MGYRDDFYTADNLIGHSGDPKSHPTVYFMRDIGKTVLFGHITQKPDVAENVGREKVNEHPEYLITNEEFEDGMHAVEWAGDDEIHTSRNRLVPIDESSDEVRALLLAAIAKCTEMKKWGEMTRAQRRMATKGGPKNMNDLKKFWKNFAAAAKKKRATTRPVQTA